MTTAPDLVDLAGVAPGWWEELVDGEDDAFGTDGLGIVWRDKTEHLGLVLDGRVVGHAGWVGSAVETDSGQRTDVVGLGGVLVHRDHRGRGLGGQLVRGATARMGDGGVPIAMLFCRTVRTAFYGRLGWQPIAGEVTADQPEGPIVMPLVTCWTSLAEGAHLPPGGLRVDGLPF